MRTLDYKVAFYDESIDPLSPDHQGQRIYIFWHEYILFPLYMRGRCNIAMLLSRHQDANVLSRVANHMGYEFVRGSTRRGGAAAVRELLRRSRRMHLAITPDGPRGPRRKLAAGPIFLASKLGLPLVATGYGYDRPWRAKSWDHFAIPRPYSRARAIASPDIFVPPDLDRDGLEHFRRRMEDLLNQITSQAEDWAASGRPMRGEQVPVPTPLPSHARHRRASSDRPPPEPPLRIWHSDNSGDTIAG
jgi:lysophospholipid acyltransferase (LPLAT)-like uncharacterized protein